MQLALGTVQFGIAYGIAGRGEAVPETEVREILEHAAAEGVTTVDTAAVYGDIESRLGRLGQGLPLEFVSKVPPIDDRLPPPEAAAFALASARRSRARLGPALRGLMTHRAKDLQGARGEAVWQALMPWARGEGIVVGASCYAPEEAVALLGDPGIRLCQIPGNALDQRVNRANAAGLGRIEVHLRSAFLQGLLLMGKERGVSRLPAATEALARWYAWASDRDMRPLEAALAVVKSFTAVSKVVIGVDDLRQWRAVTSAWGTVRPMAANELSTGDMDVIDPRCWKPHL